MDEELEFEVRVFTGSVDLSGLVLDGTDDMRELVAPEPMGPVYIDGVEYPRDDPWIRAVLAEAIELSHAEERQQERALGHSAEMESTSPGFDL